MNKAFIIIISVLMISSFGTYKMLNDVSAHRNEVEFTQREIYGDSAVLDGLDVKISLFGYLDNIVWDNDIRFNQNGFTSETDVHDVKTINYVLEKDKVFLYFYEDVNIVDPELTAIMEEITRDSMNEQHYERELYMKDYYRCFPITCSFSVNDKELIEKYGRRQYYDDAHGDYGTTAVQSYNSDKLMNYLRIGIPDSAKIIVNIVYQGVSWFNESGYHVDPKSTCSDDMVYFHVNNKDVDGNTVNFGAGYGIFRIPYGYVDQENYKGLERYSGIDIDVDKTELFYPLDERENLIELRYNEDIRGLVLVTEKDGENWLKVISDDGALIQNLFIGKSGTEYDVAGWMDTIIVNVKGEYIRLYQLHDGCYELKVTADSRKLDYVRDETGNYSDIELRGMNSKYYYNGQYLTVARTLNNNNFFVLGVFDDDELLYVGWYDSNLFSTIRWHDYIDINWK